MFFDAGGGDFSIFVILLLIPGLPQDCVKPLLPFYLHIYTYTYCTLFSYLLIIAHLRPRQTGEKVVDNCVFSTTKKIRQLLVPDRGFPHTRGKK